MSFRAVCMWTGLVSLCVVAGCNDETGAESELGTSGFGGIGIADSSGGEGTDGGLPDGEGGAGSAANTSGTGGSAGSSGGAVVSNTGGSNSGSNTGGSSTGDSTTGGSSTGDSTSGESGSADGVLHTDGRYLYDTCGERVVTRGVEQVLGNQLPPGDDYAGVVEQVAAAGANAIRLLPDLSHVTVDALDVALSRAGELGLIVYLSQPDRSWFGQQAVIDMLADHRAYLIIDAFVEPDYNDRTRWRTEVIDAIAQLRGYGYDVPLTFMANQYGRDLPSLLQYGDEIVASDPEHNVIAGWQAYWGYNGFYQGQYGMSLTAGAQVASEQDFPVQLGLAEIADEFPSVDYMDYGTLMTETEKHDLGWLWWDWYNPYYTTFSISVDGSGSNLNSVGQEVVNTHPASIANTAELACSTP